EGVGPKARRILEAPAPERMKVIKELVAGVVGLQSNRGDQLIVESLPFESTLNQQPPAIETPAPGAPVVQLPNWLPAFLKKPNAILYAAAAGAALVLLLLGALMAKFLRKKKGPGMLHAGGEEGQRTISGAPEHVKLEDLKQQMEAKLADNDRIKEQQQLEALRALQLPTVK